MKARHLVLPILLFVLTVGAGMAQQLDLKKGSKHYKANEFAEAIPYFKEAFAKDPEDADALRWLSECYIEVHDYREAQNHYEKLDQLGKMTAKDRFNYGNVLKINGEIVRAKAQFEEYSKMAQGSTEKGELMMASCDTAQFLQSAKPFFVAKSLIKINSNRSDYAPTKYGDDIIFVSARETSASDDKRNPRSGEPYSDVYFSDINTNDGSADVPVLFTGEINTPNIDEGPATFDPTGQVMFFTRSVVVKANPDLQSRGITKLQIFRAEKIDGVWTNVKELPFNSSRYSVAHPSMSWDGKELYFASDMGKGGDFDIYVVDYDGKKWSKPRSVGDTINTEGDEAFPYIHGDGTLYFSSNFHPGLGGYDIFAAKKDKDSGKWSTVMNMRKGVNSSGDDIGLMFIDGKKNKGYISSNRSGGIGMDDVYFITGDVPAQPVDKTVEKQPEKAKEVICVGGKVVERLARKEGDKWVKTNGEVVADCNLRIERNGQTVGSATTDRNGQFCIDVTEPGTYTIVAEKTGYFVTKVLVRPEDFKADDKGKRTNKTIYLEKIVLNEPNANDTMPTVYFAFDRYYIPDTTKPKLNHVADIMKDNPKIKLELAGHACPIGSDAYNEKLSRLRAEEVSQYFIKQGIEPNRIVPRSYGEKRVATSVYSQYAKNRRTELIVRSVNYPADQGNIGGPISSQAAGADGMYVVKAGDTLYRIATNNNTTVDTLKRLNGLTSNLIQIGQRLKVR